MNITWSGNCKAVIAATGDECDGYSLKGFDLARHFLRTTRRSQS